MCPATEADVAGEGESGISTGQLGQGNPASRLEDCHGLD